MKTMKDISTEYSAIIKKHLLNGETLVLDSHGRSEIFSYRDTAFSDTASVVFTDGSGRYTAVALGTYYGAGTGRMTVVLEARGLSHNGGVLYESCRTEEDLNSYIVRSWYPVGESHKLGKIYVVSEDEYERYRKLRRSRWEASRDTRKRYFAVPESMKLKILNKINGFKRLKAMGEGDELDFYRDTSTSGIYAQAIYADGTVNGKSVSIELYPKGIYATVKGVRFRV